MSDGSLTYAFEQPNPAVAARKRFALLLFVICMPFALFMCFAGDPWGLVFLVSICLGMYLSTFLRYRWGRGVVLNSDKMVVRLWLTPGSAYPWRNVASVGLVASGPLPTWRRRVKAFLRSGAINEKHVEVVLRRPVRLSLLSGWERNEGFGSGLPFGYRTFALFLQSPESFVEEAQRYLRHQGAS